MKNTILLIVFTVIFVAASVVGVKAWVDLSVERQLSAPISAPAATAPTQTAATETIPVTTAPETTAPETVVPETAAPEAAAPETAAPETTAPAPTETEAPTEPAWQPAKLTQADFTDKLTDLTDQERNDIYLMQYQGADMYRIPEEDIGQTFSQYANLDLDHDGKPDKFYYTGSGLELRMGNGTISKLDVNLSDLGAGYSAGLIFADINGTGRDDILFVHAAHSTAGTLMSLKLFTDTGSRYYQQQIPDYGFRLEDLHNDYVRLSCPHFNHREVMMIGGTECHPYLEEGQSIFDFFFSSTAVNGITDDCDIINVKIDGRRLVVLYDFRAKNSAIVTSNPFGVVYRLESGGYFVIERMGTEVIRDYWLPVENQPAA